MKKQQLPLPAQKSLDLLLEGNERFVSGVRSVESFMSATKLKELAENGQKPFAIILTCSDSRVPTEILFDRGVGDLFVIRVAGNVVVPAAIASIEYAAETFGTPICLVMGHSHCGAIQAAADCHKTGIKPESPHLRSLIESLGDVTVDGNVRNNVNRLVEDSAILSRRTAEGKFAIVGARYDLSSGKVEVLV